MKRTIICIAVAALVTIGCRKKAATPNADSSAPPAPKGEFTPAPAVPADSPAAKANSEMDQKLASGNAQLQLQVLDDLVQAWVMSKNSIPKDLEELVKEKMLSKVPAAPPGKRFAIDQKKARVVLVNQ